MILGFLADGKMITCGGQTIVMSNVDRIRPRDQKHRYCGWETKDERHACTGPAEADHTVESRILGGDIGS